MPTVSLITPCFNREKYIAETVASVCAQTFTDWEYLIIDDGSTDGSVGVIERLAAEDPRIRFVAQKNQGKARTCNRALAEAQGRYVAILDSDDLYKPDKLARQVAYLEAHPEAGMVYCGTELIDGEGRRLPDHEEMDFRRYGVGPDGRRVLVGDEDVHLFPYLVVADCIPFLTHLMRRDAALSLGPIDPDLWPGEDWDFWLRFSRRHEIHKLPDVLTSYRWHESNSCRDSDGLAQGRAAVYRKLRADASLTAEERRQLEAGIRTDVIEHADACVKWGRLAWQDKEYVSALRYWVRSRKLQWQGRRSLAS